MYIQIERLKWVGHIVRIEDHCIPKRVLRGRVKGKRLVGRPHSRWEDSVQEDALILLLI
jgi:hypothetical protein